MAFRTHQHEGRRVTQAACRRRVIRALDEMNVGFAAWDMEHRPSKAEAVVLGANRAIMNLTHTTGQRLLEGVMRAVR